MHKKNPQKTTKTKQNKKQTTPPRKKNKTKKTKQTKYPPKIIESFLFRKRHGDTETEDLANITFLHDFNMFYKSHEKINL